MLLYAPPSTTAAIPVIDLDGSFLALDQRRQVAYEVHRACRDSGFFYVANHRVPAALVEEQFAWAKRLFDLPLDEKLALSTKKSPSSAGYDPVGSQVLDSQDAQVVASPADLKESFYSAMELPDDHPYSLRHLRNFGHNQWPPTLPGFREQSIAYQAAMRDLGDRILSLIALSLELPEDWFASYYDMPGTALRLLKYPPQPGKTEFNQLGAGAHTDWGGITLLAQDQVGGLEIKTAAGNWVDASPIPGTFVINLGDLMSRWTNGIYNSNMHRVKNNSGDGDRYSLPFFYSPRPDSVIEAMPTCVNPERPSRFETCTAAEHTDEMYLRSRPERRSKHALERSDLTHFTDRC